jgi:hypothetical protein
MNSWFTVKVKYTKQLDNGTFKRVSEPYLLAAMTFTDAEARIYEELGALIKGEFIVTGISRTDIHDIFHYEDSDIWYKCKISYESEADGGEDSKSKKVAQNFLVSAHSVKEAYDRLKESLGGLMIDFQIPTISVSPIVDIFPFNDDGEDRAAVDFEKQVKKEVAEHVLGTKTVFSAAGSDIDELDDEGSVIEDNFGEEE